MRLRMRLRPTPFARGRAAVLTVSICSTAIKWLTMSRLVTSPLTNLNALVFLKAVSKLQAVGGNQQVTRVHNAKWRATSACAARA